MATIDIKVPDIGDFAEVAIIEVLVQPGDTIKAEQSLITVESDKASMEIPSSHAGVVKELRVKLGDKVAKGSVVLTLEVEGAGVAAPAAAPAPAPAAAPVTSEQKQAPALTAQAQAAINPVASSFAGTADLECDLLVLGGGPGGYSAAFRAADLGLKVVLVERCAQLGGVLQEKGMIIRLERRLTEDMKESHRTGPAPVRVHQRVDLRARVVDVERGACGRGDLQARHHRLRAVVSGTNRDAVAVQHLPDVVRVLEARYEVAGFPYSSTGSIGLTLFPRGDATTVDDLLREADTAMYRAKAGGRNRIEFFEAQMQSEVEERLAMEQDLQLALAGEQFDVHVQPQVDAQGRVVGGELLMRWHHPQRGNVPPNIFIPLAEESTLILQLGQMVLQRACEALARLQQAGRNWTLSVNVSPRQFRSPDFVECVSHVLKESGADARGLILEVTEGLLIENWQDAVSRMSELVALGLRFSIDDFGTGYSSLAYLKKLPLYELKIDRTFVRDTPGDPNDTAIVEAILSVSQHLGLRVVAEGVETREQADFLLSRGCDCLQGYFYGRPEPLGAWLARQR